MKFLRRISGLSQTKLAQEVDISRNKVASYETGVVEPNAVTFLKICDFFKIHPNDFLEDVFVDNPLEVYTSDDPVGDDSTKFIKEQIDEFIAQTNEMTKIMQGYNSFLDLQRDQNIFTENRALYSSLEDLLGLLKMLIASNWEIIQSITPSKNKS